MTDKVPVSINSGSKKTVELTARAQEVALDSMRQYQDPEEDSLPALRIAVRPGGCSGFSYEMTPEYEIDEENDEVLQFEELRVVIDSQSKELLKGSTIDYVDGLKQSGFDIDNPNANRTCGCGNSFG